MDWFLFAGFSSYFALVLWIGCSAKEDHSEVCLSEFLTGKGAHNIPIAISYVAGGRSIWLVIGLVILAYKIGLGALWSVAGITLFEAFMISSLSRSESFPGSELAGFAQWVADKTASRNLGKVIFAITTICAFVLLSFQMKVAGTQFTYMFGYENYWGVLLVGIIAGAYLFVGGVRSLILTSLAHTGIILFSLLFVSIYAVVMYGGWNMFSEQITAIAPQFFSFSTLSFNTIFGLFSIGLSAIGSPHMLHRSALISKLESVKGILPTITISNIVLGASAVFVGIVGRVYFQSYENLPNGDWSFIFAGLPEETLHNFSLGMVWSAVFAAAISTVDALVMSIVSEYTSFQVEEKRSKNNARIGLVAMLICAMMLAILLPITTTIFVKYAVLGFGAIVAPLVIAVRFLHITTKSILASVVVSSITLLIWMHGDAYFESSTVAQDVLNVPELIPAFILGLGVLLVFHFKYSKNQ